MTHAKAPRNGGVTKEAMTRLRMARDHGKSVRAVSHAMGVPMATATMPDQKASTTVFQRAFCSRGSPKTRAYCAKVKPPPSSPCTLMYTSQASGKRIRRTRAAAASTHTGAERSIRSSQAGRGRSAIGVESAPGSRLTVAGSGSEELDEARLDLLVALLQLLGIDLEQLELGELGLIGGIGHVGVA